jgi:predicted enzyme related to lactoylglutathione lyase
MAKRAQKRKGKNSKVPADDLGRAKKFYGSLFGWKFAKLPAAIADYWHIDTAGKDASPDGGLMPRLHPEQPITVYVSVPSVDKAMAKVETLGGTVCKSKTAVPHMGYFAICEDTEHNVFALWEPNGHAQ